MRKGPGVWGPRAGALTRGLPALAVLCPCLPPLPRLCHCLTPTGRLDGRTMWVGIVPCCVPQRILSSVWRVGLALVPMESCVVPLSFVNGCLLWRCLFVVVLGCPRCVVGWPKRIGRIAGTLLGHVPLASDLRMSCLIGCLTRRCSVVAAEVRLDVASGHQ